MISEEAIHESSHAALCFHFGVKIFGLAISEDGGQCWNQDPQDKLKQCCISLAGSIGANLLGHPYALPSEKDLKDALVASVSHEVKFGTPLIQQATDLCMDVLLERLKEVKTLAEYLDRVGTVSGEIAEKILSGAKVVSSEPEPQTRKIVVSV